MNGLAIGMFIFDCFASFLVAVSYLAQKKGQIKVENSGLNGTKRQNPYLTKEWIIGFGLLVISSIIHVVVLPFVDLVILSTGTAVSIVCNTLMSVMYLGEKFIPAYDYPALAMIIVGSLAIVLMSNYDETTFTPDKIRELLGSLQTIFFMVFYLIIIVITGLQYQWHRRETTKFNDKANIWLENKLNNDEIYEEVVEQQQQSGEEQTKE